VVKKTVLGDVLEDERNVKEEFYINDRDIEKWDYLKGGKNEPRITKDGYEYRYSEGSMIFPDNLDNASRTIVTGEGGTSPSRFKHVIKTKSGRLRRLTPLELERLCMFPDNHTQHMLMENGEEVEVSPTKRAFIMGNALVVGVITKLGRALRKSM
jgi:DNA (cytosine-5)-methyltransferase 1